MLMLDLPSWVASCEVDEDAPTSGGAGWDETLLSPAGTPGTLGYEEGSEPLEGAFVTEFGLPIFGGATGGSWLGPELGP